MQDRETTSIASGELPNKLLESSTYVAQTSAYKNIYAPDYGALLQGYC